MNKLRRDDEVIILTGKDKGKRGTIIQMVGDRVTVNGVNMVKRHTKPNPNLGQPGGIVEKEAADTLEASAGGSSIKVTSIAFTR